MSKHRRPETITRQGVRNLDLIGPRPTSKRPTLPPISPTGCCPRCGSPFTHGCPGEDRDIFPIEGHVRAGG
jgi:hypothetical protein